MIVVRGFMDLERVCPGGLSLPRNDRKIPTPASRRVTAYMDAAAIVSDPSKRIELRNISQSIDAPLVRTVPPVVLGVTTRLVR